MRSLFAPFTALLVIIFPGLVGATPLEDEFRDPPHPAKPWVYWDCMDGHFSKGGHHRRTKDREIYFLANRSAEPAEADCTFRVGTGRPELWGPITGDTRLLPQYEQEKGRTTIPMRFGPHQSFFVMFPRGGVAEEGTEGTQGTQGTQGNFPGTRATPTPSASSHRAEQPPPSRPGPTAPSTSKPRPTPATRS